MSLSVVQIEYVNGRSTCDVLRCPADEIVQALGRSGEFQIGDASKSFDWIMFETRDHGHLILRAEQVSYIRARPLEEGEALDTYADMARAFRDPPSPTETLVGRRGTASFGSGGEA